jgi:tetratricopeptide (TPR) repeat protein
LGNPAEAVHLIRQALIQVQAAGNAFKESLCLTNLANFEELAGNDGQARQHMEAALAISRRLDVAFSIGMQLDRLGEMAYKVGDVEAAAGYFEEALPCLESVDVPVLVEHVRGNLVLVQGEAARQHGELHKALRLYQEASAALEDGKTESLPAHCGHALDGRPIDYAYALVMRKHLEELIQTVAQAAVEAAPQATTLPTKRRRWPWGH